MAQPQTANNPPSGPFPGTASQVVPPLPSAPLNPYYGQIYYDTTLQYARVYMQDNQWHGIMNT